MNDYWGKIENLPVERLEMIVTNYRKTIRAFEVRLREATIVGMTNDINYIQAELSKKRPELAAVEQLIREKRQAQKKEQN